jgi:DNA-binding CsgD family transcriptional regulator
VVSGSRPVGRESELRALDAFLQPSPARVQAFELVGEAGSGKTACWASALETSRDRFTTVVSRPTTADARLAFGVLSDLLDPLYERHGTKLPVIQRQAVEVALRKSALTSVPGNRSDAGAVAMATLACFRAEAEERPILIAIDDLQWVDRPSARVLDYVLRRIPAGVDVMATRRVDHESPIDLDAMVGISGFRILVNRLALRPLALPALQRVLADTVGKRFPRSTLTRMADAARGNVLLMIELARALPDDLEIRPGEPLPIPAEIAPLLRRRVFRLRPPVRSVLLHAALLARPTQERLAAISGGAAAEVAIREAEAARIVVIDGGVVRFAHPLLGAATIATVAPDDVREAHRQISATSDDIEQRARHVALGSRSPTAELAALLSDAAAAARARGAPDAAAELFELKSQHKARTALHDLVAAAELYFEAGSMANSRRLFEAVIEIAPSGSVRAHAMRGLAWVSYQGSSWAEAGRLLDAALAEPNLEASAVGRLQTDAAMVHMAASDIPGAAALAASARERLEETGPPHDLAEAISLDATFRFFAGQGIDEPAFERALALEDWSSPHPVEFRPSALYPLTLYYAGLLDEARPRLSIVRERLREAGQESGIYLAAFQLSLLESLAGNLDAADALAREALEAVEINGQDSMRCFALLAAARAQASRGNLEAARLDANEGLAWAGRVGALAATAQLLHVLGFAALSEGNTVAAAAHLEPLAALLEGMGVHEPAVVPFLADAIETMVGLGQLDRATPLLEQFEARAAALDRRWALATSARCRGQLEAALGNREAATAAFARALEAHADVPMPIEKGRTLLAQGRFLRRAKQWAGARAALGEADTIFGSVGALEWQRRADEELKRVGGRRVTADRLSATEERIAVLVGEGRTNREIAEALYTSISAVESALTRAYVKVGVRSRAGLTAARATRPTA